MKLWINKTGYEIVSKKEIFSPQFQEILLKSYKRKEKFPGSEYIHCSCRDHRGKYVILHTKKYGNKISLATNKGMSAFHSFECPFNTNGIESFVKEENGEIELSSANILFLTEKQNKDKSSKTYEYDKNKDKASRNIKSFNHLVYILMDNAYSFAFNVKNKSKDRLSGKMKNVTLTEFIKMFYKLFMNTKFKNGQTISDALKKRGAKIRIGVIDYVDTKNKDLIYYREDNKTFKIPKDIWDKANRYIKKGKYYTAPPYFYLKLINRDKKILRLWLYPIANKNIFIPVESNHERNFIRKYLNSPIYKPLSTSNIKVILTKEIAKQFYSSCRADTRPDFFIFEKGKIKIIEVSPISMQKNSYYKQNLQRKINEYSNLGDIFEFFIHEPP